MTDSADLPEVEIRPLSERILKEAFSCGDDDIDTWLRKKCLSHHQGRKTRVKTAHIPEFQGMVGFYCLSIGQEDEAELTPQLRQRVRANKKQFVALKLDIIAVHKDYQRQNYGKKLLSRAIDDFYRLINEVGMLPMILECSEKVKPSFYEARGFERYGRQILNPRMFLPAQTIIEAYEDTVAEIQREQSAC